LRLATTCQFKINCSAREVFAHVVWSFVNGLVIRIHSKDANGLRSIGPRTRPSSSDTRRIAGKSTRPCAGLMGSARLRTAVSPLSHLTSTERAPGNVLRRSIRPHRRRLAPFQSSIFARTPKWSCQSRTRVHRNSWCYPLRFKQNPIQHLYGATRK